MKTAFALGLALMVGLALLGSSPAFADPRSQTSVRTPADNSWAHWGAHAHGGKFNGHGGHGQRFGGQHFNGHQFNGHYSNRVVWVPAHWSWNGWHWVAVPGHWRRW
jgi:hypothetical protein